MYHRKQKFRSWLLPLFALSISLYPSAVTAEEEEAAANSEELAEETGELPQEAPAVPYMAWDEASGTVKEVEKKRKHFCKATRYAVSGKDTGKTVKRSFKNVEIVKVKKKTEDGCKMYIVTFNTPGYRGRAKIHGVTGRIIQWEKRFLQLL